MKAYHASGYPYVRNSAATRERLAQFQTFRISAGIPEQQDIDDEGAFVDGVYDPILGSATDSKKIPAVRRARDREVAPCKRSFAEIYAQNLIEALDLLNSKVLAII